ncbi:MAG: hypothetical protein ACRYGP_29865 [Janthinobacterium lividum]
MPVIALTARSMSGDQDKAVVAGCTDYGSHPFDCSDLLAKIETYAPTKV